MVHTFFTPPFTFERNVLFTVPLDLFLVLTRVCRCLVLLVTMARMVPKLCMAGWLVCCVVSEVGSWHAGLGCTCSLLD